MSEDHIEILESLLEKLTGHTGRTNLIHRAESLIFRVWMGYADPIRLRLLALDLSDEAEGYDEELAFAFKCL